jgi:SprT-like protein
MRGDAYMVTYNIYQLKAYAQKWLMDNYGLELTVPLRINSRMQRTYGWFKHKRNRKEPVCVELNKFFVENNEPYVVLDVLRHELVHYAMYMLDKDYKDYSYGFEKELSRLGIINQERINKRIYEHEIVNKPKTKHIYQCANCNHEYKRGRALAKNRSYSCSCGGKLLDMGKRLVTS